MSGRPSIDIDPMVVRELRNSFFSWEDIASALDVSIRTLYNWRMREEWNDSWVGIDDASLDALITSFNSTNENIQRGEVMMRAHIRAKGYNPTRKRVRESIHRVDPEGVLERTSKKIQRRIYTSRGFGDCIHIDTWHKAIEYKLVISGGVDGDSRTIVYLKLANNNRAQTHLDAFIQGCHNHDELLPLSVRGDYGGENVKIARFMCDHRGYNRGAFKGGSSKHNTRIERLWRDMRQQVMDPYLDLWKSLRDEVLEGRELLNVDCQIDIYVLQYMFMGRIQYDLGMYLLL